MQGTKSNGDSFRTPALCNAGGGKWRVNGAEGTGCYLPTYKTAAACKKAGLNWMRGGEGLGCY